MIRASSIDIRLTILGNWNIMTGLLRLQYEVVMWKTGLWDTDKRREQENHQKGVTRMITAPSIENHLTAGSQNITTLSFAFLYKVLIWNIGLWDTDKKNIKKRDISTEKNKSLTKEQKEIMVTNGLTLITCIAATVIRFNGSLVNMHLPCYNWKNMCYNSFSKRNIGRLKTTTMEWHLHQKLSTFIKIICPLINVKLMLYFWTWH